MSRVKKYCNLTFSIRILTLEILNSFIPECMSFSSRSRRVWLFLRRLIYGCNGIIYFPAWYGSRRIPLAYLSVLYSFAIVRKNQI